MNNEVNREIVERVSQAERDLRTLVAGVQERELLWSVLGSAGYQWWQGRIDSGDYESIFDHLKGQALASVRGSEVVR